MKKQLLFIPLFIICALAAASVRSLAADNRGTNVQFGMRLETHSDAGSPDDYLYETLSVTKHLDGKIAANVFAVQKQNLDSGGPGGTALGVTLLRMTGPKCYALLGYAWTVNEEDSTRPDRSDRDRLRLGLFRKLSEKPDGRRIMLTGMFNTQTDWSEAQTVDLGLAWRKPLTPHWTADTEFKYTYALGPVDLHVFNQWGLKLSFKLDDNTTIDAGYLLVDKTYSGVTAALNPDDDEVFRAGVMRRLR